MSQALESKQTKNFKLEIRQREFLSAPAMVKVTENSLGTTKVTQPSEIRQLFSNGRGARESLANFNLIISF